MKPFWDNLELVLKKYLHNLNDSFPGIDYYQNKEILSGAIKYNSSHDYIFLFLFELDIYKNQMIVMISMNFYIWSHLTDKSDTE